MMMEQHTAGTSNNHPVTIRKADKGIKMTTDQERNMKNETRMATEN
jgi:hypothetical protein